MSVSFLYDTMPRKKQFTACYACEMPGRNPKIRQLSDDVYSEVQDAITRAVLEGDDSDKNKALLSLIGREECEFCNGTGGVYQEDLDVKINWSNANAAAILSLMGYKDQQLYNHNVPISEFKRRLMYALNVDPSRVERPEEIEYGKPREVSPGVIEMKPIRMFSMGLDSYEIQFKLNRLSDFVREAESNNATEIYWN